MSFKVMRKPDDAGGNGGGGNTNSGSGAQSGKAGEGTGAQANSGADTGEGAVSLTQERLEAILSSAYAKGATKAEQKAADRIKELEAELSKAKPRDRDVKDVKENTGKTYSEDELKSALSSRETELMAQINSEKDRSAKLLSSQRTSALIASASRSGAIDAEEVSTLASRFVRHDDNGEIEIVNEKGQQRFGPKGEPMTLDDFTTEFLSKRPHLKRGANTGGTGGHSDTNNKQDNAKGRQAQPRTWAEATIAAAAALQSS